MTHASLFSGIGGFDLASAWMGWDNVFQVEIDEFCQKVLQKNFPHVKRYGDIKQFDGKEYAGRIDVLTGGFPCQPFSVAGKQRGKEDDRFLWHEMLRAIREVCPSFVVAENVSGLITQGKGLVFEQVCAEMEVEGYEVQPFIIPACAVNAPHRRDRVWIIAYSDSNRKMGEGRNGSYYYFQRNATKEVQEWSNEFIRIEQSGREDATNTEGDRRHSSPQQEDGSEEMERERRCGLINSDNDVADTKFKRLERRVQSRFSTDSDKWSSWEQNWIEVATKLCRVDDGLPRKLDRNQRLKALGNAIVPQVAFEIFKAVARI